jgi:hypothetical protein
MQKSFMSLNSWCQSYKTFSVMNLLKLFGKLDHFINTNNIWPSAFEKSSLHSKNSEYINARKCYDIDSCCQSHKTFSGVNLLFGKPDHFINANNICLSVV